MSVCVCVSYLKLFSSYRFYWAKSAHACIKIAFELSIKRLDGFFLKATQNQKMKIRVAFLLGFFLSSFPSFLTYTDINICKICIYLALSFLCVPLPEERVRLRHIWFLFALPQQQQMFPYQNGYQIILLCVPRL